MNYKVLYRKYRPDDFENIIGQDYIIKTLKNSIKSGNTAHAYIFSGPRGTGKTSTAKVFAKAINCLSPCDGSPCNKCDFCCNYIENPDIIEIDAASHNGVDQIRELIDNVKLTPSNGKYKVYIIDEVHMLTQSAFNALLLTLEEPPSHVIFIFATTNIENVPITILSRCQRFDFKKISSSDIVTRLKAICKIEKIEIEDNALCEIAALSEGGLRDALSLLDQLSKNEEKITFDLVEKQVKTISNSTICELLDAIEDNNLEKVVNLINTCNDKAIDHKTFIKKMITICSKRCLEIKEYGQVKRLNYDDYKNMVYRLIDCLNKINININPFMIIELELISFIENKLKLEEKTEIQTKEVSIEEKTHVDANKKKIFNKKLNTVRNFDELIRIRVNNCFARADKSMLVDIKKHFNDFKSSLDVSKKVKAMIIDADPVASSNEYSIICVASEHLAFNLNESRDIIESEFNKFLNKNYKFIFLSLNQWNQEKKKYIKNIKENKTYELIKEESVDVSADQILELAADLFNKEKIEII